MPDLSQLGLNLSALHEEIVQLRKELDGATHLEREATLQEVLAVLSSSIEALVHCRAGLPGATNDEVLCRFDASLCELGLSRLARPGTTLELWPDEATRDFELDRSIPPGATMVKVEVLASGWIRGNKIIARPVCRVLEVVDGLE